MDEGEGGDNTTKISKYNSGIAQIMRMDELWKDTHKHSRAGRLTQWNWDLDRVWVELAGDLEDDDERIKKFDNLNLSVGKINGDFIEKKINASDYQKLIYKILLEKEIFLRKLQNELGKGTSYLESDEDYMDG